VNHADSVYYYMVRIVDDKVELGPYEARFFSTRLFRDYWRAIPLGEIDGVEAEVINWITSIPYCECYTEGHVLDYEQFGTVYDRLNVIVDDRGMQVDGPGVTLLYSREAGFVRTSLASWWTQEGTGWDLL
jgi:hypothetical protein